MSATSSGTTLDKQGFAIFLKTNHISDRIGIEIKRFLN